MLGGDMETRCFGFVLVAMFTVSIMAAVLIDPNGAMPHIVAMVGIGILAAMLWIGCLLVEIRDIFQSNSGVDKEESNDTP
jgi:hypothetical protein